MTVSVHSILFSAAILILCQDTSAWTEGTCTRTSGARMSLKSRSLIALQAEKSEATTENDKVGGVEMDDGKPAVEWGVSYIGGDPCGSKYNSDPFDKKPSDKPGMPDDMKSRIAALAQRKLQEESEKEN